MRIRLSVVAVSVSLLVLLIGLPTAQAWQSHDMSEADRRPSFRTGTSVTLCHVPPGNPENAHTIEVAEAAVPAHLAHEDTLGACPDEGECPPYPATVPATGQTTSFEFGDDGWHQKGISVEPRFTDNLDGTVTDNLTGLIWLQDAECFGFKFWASALSAANTLADGSCGLSDSSAASDWRLPNVRELQSIVDYGVHSPSIDPIFGQTTEYSYWSSTTVAGFTSGAWVVFIGNGTVVNNPKNSAHGVRAVRGCR